MNKFLCSVMLATACLDLSGVRLWQEYIQLCHISSIYKKHPTKIIPTLVARRNWHAEQGGSKNLKQTTAIDTFLRDGKEKLSAAQACEKLLNDFDTAVGGAQMYASITHKDCATALGAVNKKICCMDGFILGKRTCRSTSDHQPNYQAVDLKSLGWKNSREQMRRFIDDVVVQCPQCMSNIITKK